MFYNYILPENHPRVSISYSPSTLILLFHIRQLKSLGWDDVLQSLSAPPSQSPNAAAQQETAQLRQKWQEQQLRLGEEEQQRSNLEVFHCERKNNSGRILRYFIGGGRTTAIES